MAELTQRYRGVIDGVLGCFDRVVITGTLPDICHHGAMMMYLRENKIPLERFSDHFKKLKDEVMGNARAIGARNGVPVEYISRKNFRKDDRIREILAERGDHPGLVHIFSGMEPLYTFRPQIQRPSGRRYLAERYGKCGHVYFYFVDAEFGLCYMRVPTWAPYRLQFYFNGHNWLARQLEREGIGYELVDNAFVHIEDYARAQELADGFSVRALHQKLDDYARLLCPVLRFFGRGVRWSIMQLEHATDVVFESAEALGPVYSELVRTAIHAVKADDVATFLGRRLDRRFVGEVGSQFHTRVMGTRIRHHMGQASIKMYDKHGRVLRIETTASDVTFFKHHRLVEHRDGTRTRKIASVRKNIYSLTAMAELMAAANARYLEFISTLDDPSDGARNLDKLGRSVRIAGRSYRGFNLLQRADLRVLLGLVRGEFNITGMRNRHLRLLLGLSNRQVSRILKRLHVHGLIKKVAGTYKYYLTRLGRAVISCGLQLRENLLIPRLALAAN